MNDQAFISELLAASDLAIQQQFLQNQQANLQQNTLWADEIAQALKAEADHCLRSGQLPRALQMIELLTTLSQRTNNPLYQALALRAKGNVYAIGQGDHKQAIAAYDQACHIYQQNNHLTEEAITQTGRIWSLTNLGHHNEALAAGQWAIKVLEKSQQPKMQLIPILGNVANIHFRLGDDQTALAYADRMKHIYQQLGQDNFLPSVEMIRGIFLSNLGRFQAAEQALHQAYEGFVRLEHTVEAARSQQNLAMTYFVLGRYTEALSILDKVLAIYQADGRWGDVAFLELTISNYLLQLRRFASVVEKSQQLRHDYQQRGMTLELARTIFYEAVAHAGRQRYEEALTALQEARHLFEQEGSTIFTAQVDLETADILYRQAKFDQSLSLAQQSLIHFQKHSLILLAAQARLLMVRVALAQNNLNHAYEQATAVLTLDQTQHIPQLAYQAQALLGELALSQGQQTMALTHYQQAMTALEQLQNHLMVEYRPDFLQDKQIIYEKYIDICTQLGKPDQGFLGASRAKSRVLLDLIAQRVQLHIQPQDETDKELINELQQLRERRDQYYRRLSFAEETETAISPQMTTLEAKITSKWHTLLIRNAAYARDADLWYAHATSLSTLQQHLTPQDLLLDYFVTSQATILFMVTQDSIQLHRLTVTPAQFMQTYQRFRLRVNLAARSHPSKNQNQITTTCRQLAHLYQLLLAPISNTLNQFSRLIIVPHALLHYIPFHALHNGRSYLLETHQVRYLPNASLLPYYQTNTTTSHNNCLAFGYSATGNLPNAVAEAQLVAQTMQGQAFVEQAANLTTLRQQASQCRLLHLATHGDFRADNPLFSGLALADGQLTTLDIFSLKLAASLVTLSACRTGQHVISGGDELLGLTRAFMYAGAASLLLTLWPVHDQATTTFMSHFYHLLKTGHTKGAALQQTQQHFINHHQKTSATYAHPYYWAPFFLVGDTGPL